MEKLSMLNHNIYLKASNTLEDQLVLLKNPISKGDKTCPQEIIQKIMLRPGLWVSIMDFTPSKAFTLEYEKKQSTIDFGYILSGAMRRQFHSRSTEKMEFENRSGMAGVVFIPESEGILEIQRQQKILVFHIHITPELLHSFLKEDLSILPSAFKTVLDGSKKDLS
jgi:hypothetical protein